MNVVSRKVQMNKTSVYRHVYRLTGNVLTSCACQSIMLRWKASALYGAYRNR